MLLHQFGGDKEEGRDQMGMHSGKLRNGELLIVTKKRTKMNMKMKMKIRIAVAMKMYVLVQVIQLVSMRKMSSFLVKMYGK